MPECPICFSLSCLNQPGPEFLNTLNPETWLVETRQAKAYRTLCMRPVSSIHIMRTRVSFMVILICCLLSASATAQEASSTKFDAFNDLPTDDTQAHLDLFAQELRKDETLQGFVVGYRSTSTLPGWHLRKIFGYLDYLANSRGVNPGNVQVVDAGTARTTLTELWLVPGGAKNPKSSDISK